MLSTLKTFLALLVLAVLAGYLVASCAAVITTPYRPRPPRGKYSLEQAQRHAAKLRSPKYQNRRYYPARPK